MSEFGQTKGKGEPERRREGKKEGEESACREGGETGRKRGSLARLVWYVAHVGCIRMRREKNPLSQSVRQTKSVSEGVSEGG